METNACRNIAILVGIALVIFNPLFYAHYFYTDEVLQLWNYRKGTNFAMFIPQGRFLTDWLFRSLFSSIDTIPQLTRLRLFSFVGWLLCLPVWYTIIARVSRKEGLPDMFPFVVVLYLITSPPFSVYVQWAAVMELFIANTSGLIAGYFIYSHIQLVEGGTGQLAQGRFRLSPVGIMLALPFSLISLFTYQNGFGCFLLPFFLHLIAGKRLSRTIIKGVIAYLLMYVVYYLLFHWQIYATHMDTSERTSLVTNPFSKLYYVFSKPFPEAFYFTWIVNEKSIAGRIIYGLVFGGCLLINFRRMASGSVASRLTYLAYIIAGFMLIYLPSLVVHENFASNRTLLALDMAVFAWVFITVLSLIKDKKVQLAMVAVMGVLFIAGSWYNFRIRFLEPAKMEYAQMKAYVDTHYSPGVTSVEFIPPTEDLYRRKFGISSSWDEFGMPSTFFKWVPDPLIRQLVFEKTGSRQAADSLHISSWPDKNAWLQSRSQPAGNKLVIDAENILLNKNNF